MVDKAEGETLKKLSFEAKLSIVISIILAFGLLTGPPLWWKHTPWGRPAGASSPSLPPGVVGMSGGCDAFQVFAQNRWDPVGAVVRAAPNITSKIEGVGYAGNQSIAVNGWVHSRPAYPTNTSPWNSDIWFHLADDSGWVSFAGVRARPVNHDPSGLSKDGGTPAATSSKCEAAVQ